jgi:hypothetical protein
MKSTLKLTAALLCLQLLAITAFAQDIQKAFTGIWELAQAGANGQALQNSPPGYLKIFNDSTFANVQVRNTGSVISHGGRFLVNDSQNYTETALYRLPEMTGGPLGKGFHLKYLFSEDRKQLTITFTLESGIESGIALTEIWRRL